MGDPRVSVSGAPHSSIHPSITSQDYGDGHHPSSFVIISNQVNLALTSGIFTQNSVFTTSSTWRVSCFGLYGSPSLRNFQVDVVFIGMWILLLWWWWHSAWWGGECRGVIDVGCQNRSYCIGNKLDQLPGYMISSWLSLFVWPRYWDHVAYSAMLHRAASWKPAHCMYIACTIYLHRSHTRI